jgi:hypothetical protein
VGMIRIYDLQDCTPLFDIRILSKYKGMGFEITGLVEPMPEESLLNTVPGMLDELRRPMMLLISSRKK